MTEATLVVPIQVSALAVDRAVLAQDNFRLWPFAYTALANFTSPEPAAGDRNTGGGQLGVTLHWTLPDALRHGSQQAAGMAFPLVPNRWLVARYTGQQARAVTAWVLEADCPYSPHARDQGFDDTRCSLYLVTPDVISGWLASADPFRAGVQLDPHAAGPQVANIGLAFPAAGWTERSQKPSFLTAVAPGNAAFSAYVPHHGNVFAFQDDLHGIDQDTVSYAVIGWYSDPAADILASSTPAALNWTVTGTGTALRSVYQGLVLSLPWQRDGTRATADPLRDIRASGKLGVGIGNTTEDAFLALARRELAARKLDTSALPLLRAFLYGVLPLLNETAGDVAVQRRIADLSFGAQPAGYTWTIAPPASASGGAPPHDVPFAPPGWLAELNNDQARLDAELAALYALQWELNALWIKQGLLPHVSWPAPPQGAPTATQLAAALDPSVPGSVTARLLTQLAAVMTLVDHVPQPVPGPGTPQDALERGIAAYAAARGGLPTGAMLKLVPLAPFRRPAGPVVAIAGVTPPALSQRGAPLPVRTDAALVTTLTAGGKTISAAGMPVPPSLAAMPDVVGPLLREFFLLDPANAAALASAAGLPEATVRAAIQAHASYQGSLPALDLSAWTAQPWEPLFFEWSVDYQPVPLDGGGTGPWQFDGDDYRLGTAQASASPLSIGAISLLSQHAPVVFGDRLAEFVKQHGDAAALAQLDGWLDQVGAWQVLSQELTGFDEMLALRDHRAFRHPGPADTVGPASRPRSVADLIGAVGAGTGHDDLPDRYRGQVTTWPYLPTGPALPFAGVRAGQLYFTQVLLYDAFGRVLHVIEPGTDAGLYQAQNFPADIDPALAPDHSLTPSVASVVQLPPRLTQGARLDLALLDAATSVPLGRAGAAANPVGGWILANHLDASLLLYAADGGSLGTFRLYATADGSKAGAWSPPAHSAVRTLDDVAARSSLVHSLITAPALASEASFSGLLSVIDAALWTIDPSGARADQSLAALVGRPLAVLPLRLTLQLDGPARTDPGWAATLAPPPAAVLSVPFPVRLGDQAARDDGLVGYFGHGDFSVLNTVAAPPGPVPYLNQIGADSGHGRNYVTVQAAPPGGGPAVDVVALADPRAAIRATCGLVPAATVAVPDVFVRPALSAIEIQLQCPATLVRRGPAPAAAGLPPAFAQAVTMPVPGPAAGQWTWWEPDGAGGWTGSAVTPATTDAVLTGGAAELADGILQLVANLSRLPRP